MAEPDQVDREPSFYLASNESKCLEGSRACWRIRTLRHERRDDLLLVRLDRAVLVDNLPRSRVVLAARHVGCSIVAPSEWPVHVHVALVPDRSEQTGIISAADLREFAWGEAYLTVDSARISVSRTHALARHLAEGKDAPLALEELSFVTRDDGELERAIKIRVGRALDSAGDAERGYLVVIDREHPGGTDRLVGLCLRPASALGAEAESRICDALAGVLGAGTRARFIGIDELMERRLRRLCSPFFSRVSTIGIE